MCRVPCRCRACGLGAGLLPCANWVAWRGRGHRLLAAMPGWRTAPGPRRGMSSDLPVPVPAPGRAGGWQGGSWCRCRSERGIWDQRLPTPGLVLAMGTWRPHWDTGICPSRLWLLPAPVPSATSGSSWPHRRPGPQRGTAPGTGCYGGQLRAGGSLRGRWAGRCRQTAAALAWGRAGLPDPPPSGPKNNCGGRRRKGNRRDPGSAGFR